MRWLLLLAVVLLLNACTDTDAPGDQEKNRVLLELRPYAPSFMEVEPIQTRAFPGDYGYYVYGDANVSGQFTKQTSLQDATIHMLFFKDVPGTPADEVMQEGTFTKSGTSWRSLVEMGSDSYYLYGYIPKAVAQGVENITYVDGDFKKGITFTIKKMSSITPSDVCVAVAAGRGDDTGPDDDFGIGKFHFKAVPGENVKNYVYLLFDHIYSAICFSFKVDENSKYDELRTIKLKKLRLLSSSISKYVDATITLYANDQGVNPLRATSVSFSNNGTATVTGEDAKDGLLFDATEGNANPVVITNEPSNFLGSFVPGNYDAFTLESTFDVYDKNETTEHPEGNRVRKDCVATNSIKLKNILQSGTWKRGVMLKLTLKVEPTYLYMLSEPDLDNPTVTLLSGN